MERVEQIDEEAIRQMQLETYIPMIWRHLNFLYVGANLEEFSFRQGLTMAYDFFNAQIEIVEIDEDRAKAVLAKYPWVSHAMIIDIGQGGLSRARKSYECSLWVNGPGLLPTTKEIDTALHSLQLITSGMLVIMNPWGRVRYRNGEDEILHKHDVYRTPLLPDFFLQRGFAVHLIGQKDTKGGNILAWKDLSLQPKSWRRQPCPDSKEYESRLRMPGDCY